MIYTWVIGTLRAFKFLQNLFTTDLKFPIRPVRVEVSLHDPAEHPARWPFKEAFGLGTAGGADLLEIPVGMFKKCYKLDALLMDPHVPGSNIPTYSRGDRIEDFFLDHNL